ncbi:MAG: glycosyltransferase [Mariniphaga sp.]|nr:glycosyltransferase [Mariniphaga sp.]
MFADKYILKNNLDKVLFDQLPHSETGIIVVIPCINEPDILETLNSLQNCTGPKCKVEVIILINHSEVSSKELKSYNQKTFKEVSDWINNSEKEIFQFLVSPPINLAKKWAGVGMARKRGMDEASCRFNFLDKPEGLIVSLDSDTLVERNYLLEIEKHFKENPEHVGATVAFEHQLVGLDKKQRQGILYYEQYLKYYKSALTYTGYPFAMFTIGSAFVVTADAYVKRGGMTRRKAGEDFYFLQNLAQQGTVGEITSTKVLPSARTSERVPFGTGPIIKKWMEGKEDLSVTYNFHAFFDLKEFFNQKENLYKISELEFEDLLNKLPSPVSSFLMNDEFFVQLNDLNQNCSSLRIFNYRFYQIFNAFKILKFLNFGHQEFYKKADIDDQVKQLNKKCQ